MAENEAKPTEANPPKKSKHRSPNYPSIGLEKALERSQTIKEQAGRNNMTASVAYGLWGYKAGAGAQVVAALKAFGLIETTGEKEKRQIRLTETAWRILGNAPDRAQLLKDAALKPEIHKEVWDKYNGDLPNADAVISDWLVWEKGFNQSFVGGFVVQLRGTIAFANLVLSDKVDPVIKGKLPERVKPPMNAATNTLRDGNPPPVGQRVFPLYLSAEQEAALYVPSKMMQSEYDLLKQQIDNSLLVMRATSVIPDPLPHAGGIETPYPRGATWRNKDHDQPVTITGELGEKGGKRFFAAKETGTGIPEDELEFEDAKAKGAG